MTIYIASSWRNQHAVEMLTALLREQRHKVLSFVEYESKDANIFYEKGFEAWIKTEGARECFTYDTESAMMSDLVIYLAPSGKDACAEMGAAYAKGVPIIGLHAKGEDLGLMRYMVTKWFNQYRELLNCVQEYQQLFNPPNSNI